MVQGFRVLGVRVTVLGFREHGFGVTRLRTSRLHDAVHTTEDCFVLEVSARTHASS